MENDDSAATPDQRSSLPRPVLLELFQYARNLVSNHNPSPWYFAFALFLQTMQILSYPFGDGNTGGSISHLAATALNVSNIRFLSDSGQNVLLIVALVAMCLYIVLTVAAVFRVSKLNSTSSAQVEQGVLPQVVAILTFAMTSWLSVPLLDALFCPVFSPAPDSLAYISALLAFPLMASITILVKGTMISLDPFSSNILAQVHARFDLSAAAFRCVVLFCFNAFGAKIASFICLLPSLALSYSYAMVGPYYSTVANQLHSISSSLIFWSFFCSSTATIVSSNVALQVFLISAPFITGAAFFVVWIRQSMIADMSPLLMKDAFQVQLCVHQILSPIRLQHQSRIKRNVEIEQNSTLMDTVQNVFTQTTTTLPNSAMLQIFRAMFFLFYRHNMFEALAHLRSAERLSPGLDLYYIICVLRFVISDIFFSDSESKATAEFAAFNNILTKAMDADYVATNLHIQLWSSLDRTTNDDLVRFSADIHKALMDATQSYTRCLEIAPTSDTVKRLYAGFTRDILHDQTTANEVVNELELRSNKTSFDGNLQKNFSQHLFNEENPVIMISGHPERLGQIIDCNASAVMKFGFGTKAALLQHNISILVPPPISSIHSKLMRENLESGRRSIRNSTRSVFAVDRNGYLIPIYLYVTWFSSSLEDVTVVGLMSLDHPDRDSYLATVDIKTGNLTAVNERFAKMFDIQLQNVTREKIAIDRIIADFNRDVAVFLEPNGATIEASNLRRRPFNMKFTEVRVVVTILSSLYLVRIHRNIADNHRASSVFFQRFSSVDFRRLAEIDLGVSEIDSPKLRHRKSRLNRSASQAFTAISDNTVVQPQSGTSSLSAISNDIRTRLLHGKKAQVSARSRRFQVIFYFMNFTIVVLAISIYLITSSMFSSFAARVDFMISTGSHQRLDSMIISDYTHRLILLQQQLMNSTTDGDADAVIAGLTTATDGLSASIDAIYVSRRSLDSEYLNLLDHDVVNAQELDPSDKVSFHRYTLFDFGLLLMASGRYVSHLVLSDIVSTDYQISFALMNGAYAGVNWYHKTSDLLWLQIQSFYSTTRILVTSLSFLAIIIVFVAIFVVIWSAVKRFRIVTNTIVELFELIPYQTCEVLRKHYDQRAVLHHALNNDGLHDNDDLKNYFEKSSYFEDLQSTARPEAGTGRKLVRKASSYDIRTIAKVSAGVVLCMVYFIATYITGFVNVQDTVLYKPAECNWSSYRSMAILKVAMKLRILAVQGGSQVLGVTGSEVLAAIDDLERVHNGLVRGSDAMGLASVDSLYNLQADLLSSNACTPPSWTECLNFQNKLLQGGLNAGLREFIARARSAVTAITATCSPCLRPDQMQRALSIPDLAFTRILYNRYLAPTLAVSVDRYQQAMQYKMLTEYQQISVTLLIVFIVLILASLFMIYHPMILRYNDSLQNAQTMLLLIPKHITETDYHLRSYLEANRQSLVI